MHQSLNDKTTKDRVWYKNINGNGKQAFITMNNVWHFISFVSVKYFPESMGPLVTSQGNLAKVYFGFKKIEEIIHIYKDTLENTAKRF